MVFGKLLPREGNFFEMFNQHAERIVEAWSAEDPANAHRKDLHLRAIRQVVANCLEAISRWQQR